MPGRGRMSAAAILWLARALGWVRQAAGALAALALRYPWQAACAALLGCSVLLWRGEHAAIDQRNRARADASALTAASNRAAALAAAQRKADEQHYKELADHADVHYRSQLAGARDATARYIAAHRLRPGAVAGPGGGTAGEAQGRGAAVPGQSAAEAELVAVSAADVDRCAADYGYAKAAFDWAASLGR